MQKIHAAITAVGGYAPEYVMTNKELETIIDTTDEWIQTRTGIKERRILKGEGKGTSDIAVEAVKDLLQKRGIGPEENRHGDMRHYYSGYGFSPATANVISDKAGLVNAFGYDVSAACSGFLFALTTGSQFIETGKYKKVLVIGVDKMSFYTEL